MRVLLDECLPKRLKHRITEHEVSTVPEMGWSGKKNGELLNLAEAIFDIFITADQNLQYQQNLTSTNMGIILLIARTNRYNDLEPLVPKLLQALENTVYGQVVSVTFS